MRYIPVLLIGTLITFISLNSLALSPGDQSKQEYKKGTDRAAVKDYEGAIAIFENVFRRYKTPKALFSMGLCKRLVGRYLEAKADFEKFLALPGIDADLKLRAETFISKIKNILSRLTINDAPNGVTVKVDGVSVGTTPLRKMVFLEPGQHNVELIKKGYKSLSRTVVADAGIKIVVSAALIPSAISIKISCEIESAVVWIDGKKRGLCPYKGELKPGAHKVEVRVPEKPAFKQVINVAPGDTIVLKPSWGQDVTSSPVAQDMNVPADKNEHQGLKVAGIAGVVLGLCGTGVGVGFTVYGQKTDNKADSLADQHDGSWGNDEVADYQSKIDTAKAGSIIGYGVGGAMLIAGSILLIIRSRKTGSMSKEKLIVSPTASGIMVRF